MHYKLTHIEPALALAKTTAKEKHTICTVVAGTDMRCKVVPARMTTSEALEQELIALWYVSSAGTLTDCITRDPVISMGKTVEQKNRGRFACGVLGHTLLVRVEGSGITETRFCSRCGDPVSSLPEQIPLGINLRVYRDAFKKLSWRHKLFGIYEPFSDKYRTNWYL